MPGNKLQGALSKSPSNAGLTRVSPGIYRNAEGRLVRQGGGALPQTENDSSLRNRATNAANQEFERMKGQGTQGAPMGQNELGKFGPIGNLDLRYPSNTSMPNLMNTMTQGFGGQNPQYSPQEMQQRQNFAAGLQSPRSLGFHQQRQPGQEMQGAGFQLSPQELERRRAIMEGYDFQNQMGQFSTQQQMPTPMPRGGYRR